MKTCPNCELNRCNCTYAEQAAAMRKKEVERREDERKKGNNPVIVDFLTREV